MGFIRSTLGAIIGAVTSAFLLRAWKISKQQGKPMAEVISDFPSWLADDVQLLKSAGTEAFNDGMKEAQRVEAEVERMLVTPRRKGIRKDG